jgi:hypothetical protein
MDYLLTAIIVLLLAYIAWREHLSYRERTELTDRLMARSLPEYKDNQAPEPNQLDTPPTDVIDLDEAREELNGQSDE